MTGVALRTLRRAAGMTLADLAAAAGVSMSYASRVEAGVVLPRPKWVAHVVDVLGRELAP